MRSSCPEAASNKRESLNLQRQTGKHLHPNTSTELRGMTRPALGFLYSFILFSFIPVTSSMSLDLTELRNKVSKIKVNPRGNLWATGKKCMFDLNKELALTLFNKLYNYMYMCILIHMSESYVCRIYKM
uniref:Neuromedin Bb n=1 Tax=Periophthalmus magnuspinnatus TaxID=409849 RepID=A0A3B4A0P4_9GOBI